VLSVAKYFPERMYGFLRSLDGSDVYFHLGDFEGGSPPPIIGERVEAHFNAPESDKAPKAQTVKRLDDPRSVKGVVDTFNADKGWGFVKGDDGQDYYLHRSEVLDGMLPMPGRRVTFFAGYKNERPRACYVGIEDKHG
jgi:cold shock CspA family protein